MLPCFIKTLDFLHFPRFRGKQEHCWAVQWFTGVLHTPETAAFNAINEQMLDHIPGEAG